MGGQKEEGNEMKTEVIEMVETPYEAGPTPTAAIAAMRAWAMDPTPAEVPDFTAAWAQIREDLEDQAAGAFRIGQNLIKIRDRLKPLGLWPAALKEHGMSQPQASRYIRFAEMPERDREVYLRLAGPFSLSAAIGERRSSDRAPVAADHSRRIVAVPAIPEDEIEDQIEFLMTIARQIVEEGEDSYDTEHVKVLLGAMQAVLDVGLEAELRRRLSAQRRLDKRM